MKLKISVALNFILVAIAALLWFESTVGAEANEFYFKMKVRWVLKGAAAEIGRGKAEEVRKAFESVGPDLTEADLIALADKFHVTSSSKP